MKGQFLFLWLLVCLVPLVASKGSKNSLNVQLKHFNEADADSDGQVDLNEVNTFIVSTTLNYYINMLMIPDSYEAKTTKNQTLMSHFSWLFYNWPSFKNLNVAL